jgi:putative ABC transport system permease protein
MYAVKTLFDQPFRYIITAFGIALCVVLMLFLLGIYNGVASGSVEYIRANDAEIWVLQKHATNILRSTSLLRSGTGSRLEEIDGVEAVSPVAFVMASVKLPSGNKTLYLTGFDPETGRGGPPEIYRGRTIREDDEIVLDRAFAEKNDIQVGESVIVKRDTLKVVGISRKTNMVVIQYAFVSLTETYRILGFSGIVSCFVVKLKPGQDPEKVSKAIHRILPDVAAYDRNTFLKNNIAEMETGILPLLYMIALIGSVVLTAILSLILSINVLERRKDFAVMKALGAPRAFIPGLVVVQSLVLSFTGVIAGIALFFPLIHILSGIAPEVTVLPASGHVVFVSAGVFAISLISSVFPIQKLRKIYPWEVFR